MLVFRVAHSVCKKAGTSYFSGPYSTKTEPTLPEGTADELVYPMSRKHSGDFEHPSPLDCARLDGIEPWEVCGLVSRAALDKWFDGWHDVLARFGFQVYVFDVPEAHVRVGRYGQCVFDPEHASLVRTEEVVTQ